MDPESGADDERARLDEYVRMLRRVVGALVARAGGRVELTGVELDKPRNMAFEPSAGDPTGLVVRITES